MNKQPRERRIINIAATLMTRKLETSVLADKNRLRQVMGLQIKTTGHAFCNGRLTGLMGFCNYYTKRMMNMKISRLRIVGFVIVMVGLSSCGQKKQPSTSDKDSDGWKTFETADYSIKYPGFWAFDNSGRMGMALQILSPQTSADDNFRDNVNLVIQDLSGQTVKTLGQYTQLSVSQIKAMMTNSEILSSVRLTRDGQEFQMVIFKAVQGQFKLMFVQYYLIKGKMAYALTLTFEADKFDVYSEVGGKILDSFKMKK